MGRNGVFKATGLALTKCIDSNEQSVIVIEPVTSKQVAGRCNIEIPIEDIPALIAELKKFNACKKKSSFKNKCGVIIKNGNKSWYKNGQLHREDGPAVECADGTKIWYRNDQVHRENGPAIECINGTKIWYFNGKLHRKDGPAVEHVDGIKSWFINGQEFSEQEFNAVKHYLL